MDFQMIKDILELIAIVFGGTSLTWAAFIVTRKQFHHSVMISCIERFQQIFSDLTSSDSTKRLDAIQKYVDLCNEELFYFKEKYVPIEVAKEWLDGMIYYLPLFNRHGEILAPGKFPEILDNHSLDFYPRIKKAFQVATLPDMENPHERIACIEEILKNVKRLTYPCA